MGTASSDAGRTVVTVRRVGSEAEPLVVIDHATRQGDGLRDFATTRTTFFPASDQASGYPGLLAAAPVAYLDAMVRLVLPLIARHFTGSPVRPARARGNFSLITATPDTLTPDQRAPHVDATDRMQFATVHFLSDHPAGTGFFRHRATGFETIGADRLPIYSAARAADPAPPHGYCTGCDAAFDLIDQVPARFDRLILYRAALLHSGLIDAPPAQAADPRHGRLTANLFLQCGAA